MKAASYEQQTVANPSRLKRFSHRARFDLALRLLQPRGGERILDYGGGDGHLVALLQAVEPAATYRLYEPQASMADQAEQRLRASQLEACLLREHAQLQGQQFDKLACCEVLEHLEDEQIAAAFADFRALLPVGGQLLISVPLEVGLSALAKNLLRAWMRQPQRQAGSRNVLRALFGRVGGMPRVGDDGYIHSHLGFDHRTLRQRLGREGFAIERERYSPLPWLRGILNSQVFWLCSRL